MPVENVALTTEAKLNASSVAPKSSVKRTTSSVMKSLKRCNNLSSMVSIQNIKSRVGVSKNICQKNLSKPVKIAIKSEVQALAIEINKEPINNEEDTMKVEKIQIATPILIKNKEYSNSPTLNTQSTMKTTRSKSKIDPMKKSKDKIAIRDLVNLKGISK